MSFGPRESRFVKQIAPFIASLAVLLSGCATPTAPPPANITSVAPSATGIPNSVASFGNFEFVSIQGPGLIFTYNLSTGLQVQAAAPYATPCADPSGMVISTTGASSVMAVVCYDTGTLLTLTVHSDGSLTALGSVAGLPEPYPGIVLDGTNVFVPLFGQSSVANGGVARISLASPANPVITGTATLASPAPGEFANPGYLAVAGGYIYLAAGSESAPQSTSSTIQVVNESTMALVGPPLVVAHSPQQIAVQGSTAYVTFYDAAQLESINITNPASLQALQIASLAAAPGCQALPIVLNGDTAYVGCYAEGVVEQFDITSPSSMKFTQTIPGIAAPQRLLIANGNLLASSSTNGGAVYLINLGAITLSGSVNTP